jgi:hypothetical protein
VVNIDYYGNQHNESGFLPLFMPEPPGKQKGHQEMEGIMNYMPQYHDWKDIVSQNKKQ